ncbi:hypothetical protein CEV34_0993 [Brucella pseudogrignonensis]|uniref:Uncharacterized protein n=1 Tax=Brucella pseudogrignonensis TaxID=419475 RepID=A0A256GP39_9HYPH|nr:hypothetical protein CEV34_0993 [Brucella pseudogrignonensis]
MPWFSLKNAVEISALLVEDKTHSVKWVWPKKKQAGFPRPVC